MRFYRERGLYESLYTPSSLEIKERIPVLANDLVIPRALDPYKDDLFYLEDRKSNFPVRERLVRRSSKAGATVFDGEILYVDRVEIEEGTIKKVALRRCNYFAYASLSLQLQKALRTRGRRSMQHKRHLTTFNTAISRPLQPQALGCGVVTLFEENGELFVALAHRSPEVLNVSNIKGILPTFGAESNIVGSERSRYSLLFYNYLKEFIEEFFDLEELVEMVKARRGHPDWILQLPAAKTIAREVKNGRLTMEYLGVAINPIDGAFLCATLAWFRPGSFYHALKRDLRVNWESSPDEQNAPAVQFVPLFDPHIDEWIDQGEIDPGSAFAIDLARGRVKEIRREGLDRER